jgi:ATP-dependent helicase/nuclease subunit B
VDLGGLPSAFARAARDSDRSLDRLGPGPIFGRLEALRKDREADLRLAGKSRDSEDELGESGLEALEREFNEVAWLKEAVQRLLEFIPEATPQKEVDFAALCNGLARLVSECAAARTDLDREAANVIAGQLCELGSLRVEPLAAPLTVGQALDRLRASVFGLTVGRSAPQAGRLHLSSFVSGGFSRRPVTFICGLDQGSFPGSGLQDPVLLDEERARISEGLPTTADSLREDLYRMASLLASLGEGRAEVASGVPTARRVTLSYPSFEVGEGRPCFPSSLILQASARHGPTHGQLLDLDRGLAEASGFLRSGRQGL